MTDCPSKPSALTPAHRALVRLLAGIAVETFMEEVQASTVAQDRHSEPISRRRGDRIEEATHDARR
jgi:hypothetical protein